MNSAVPSSCWPQVVVGGALDTPALRWMGSPDRVSAFAAWTDRAFFRDSSEFDKQSVSGEPMRSIGSRQTATMRQTAAGRTNIERMLTRIRRGQPMTIHK